MYLLSVVVNPAEIIFLCKSKNTIQLLENENENENLFLQKASKPS